MTQQSLEDRTANAWKAKLQIQWDNHIGELGVRIRVTFISLLSTCPHRNFYTQNNQNVLKFYVHQYHALEINSSKPIKQKVQHLLTKLFFRDPCIFKHLSLMGVARCHQTFQPALVFQVGKAREIFFCVPDKYVEYQEKQFPICYLQTIVLIYYQ